jgi:hypothetical protein
MCERAAQEDRGRLPFASFCSRPPHMHGGSFAIARTIPWVSLPPSEPSFWRGLPPQQAAAFHRPNHRHPRRQKSSWTVAGKQAGRSGRQVRKQRVKEGGCRRVEQYIRSIDNKRDGESDKAKEQRGLCEKVCVRACYKGRQDARFVPGKPPAARLPGQSEHRRSSVPIGREGQPPCVCVCACACVCGDDVP